MSDLLKENDELQVKMIDEIKKMKKEKNAVILAHLYQWGEIQDIADFVGDSLDLSKKARNTDADMIVFCGVYFMAETAKILSPEKRVLLPEIHAGCPMADMITENDIDDLRQEYPKAAVVCYVNSSAAVKAKSDICCTSSNAVAVVRSLKEEEIIFVPDQNLGHYVSRFVPEKKIILYKGFCPTHHKITVEDMVRVRKIHSGIPILVHPECRPDVVDTADFIGSTAQIIDYVKNHEDKKFIIGTESGILHALKKQCPDKKFYSLHSAMVCPNMKKTTIESVYKSLLKNQYEIFIDENTMSNAKLSLDRMLDVM